MAKKKLILNKRKKTGIDETLVISFEAVTESTTETEKIVETEAVTPEIDVPVLDNELKIENGILGNQQDLEEENTTLCKFEKNVSEQETISLECTEVLADPVDDFNKSIRKLMLDRNEIYKPYIESENKYQDTVSEILPVIENNKIQSRNDKVTNSSRTTAPKSRRSTLVSRNRTL